jgi:hypothetical protein
MHDNSSISNGKTHKFDLAGFAFSVGEMPKGPRLLAEKCFRQDRGNSLGGENVLYLVS